MVGKIRKIEVIKLGIGKLGGEKDEIKKLRRKIKIEEEEWRWKEFELKESKVVKLIRRFRIMLVDEIGREVKDKNLRNGENFIEEVEDERDEVGMERVMKIKMGDME